MQTYKDCPKLQFLLLLDIGHNIDRATVNVHKREGVYICTLRIYVQSTHHIYSLPHIFTGPLSGALKQKIHVQAMSVITCALYHT